MLMDKEVGVAMQAAFIDFMRLRIGPFEFETVSAVTELGDAALAADMKHRVEQMAKQIKSGKL